MASPGMIVRGQFPPWLRPEILSASINAFREHPPIWRRTVKVMRSSKSKEETFITEPTGYPARIPEGAGVGYDSPAQGPGKTFVHETFGLGAKISAEMMEDNQFSRAFDLAGMLGFSVRQGIEAKVAGLWNAGFGTSLFTAADGLAPFTTNHTLVGGGVATFANEPSVASALTPSTFLSGLYTIRRHKSGRGQPLRYGFGSVTLMVPIELEGIAWTIKNSRQLPGTANNDDNFLKSLDINILVNPYLTSTTAWFLLTPEHQFKYFVRRSPTASRDGDWDSGAMKFKVTYRCSLGVDDVRGTFANPGA